MITGLLRMHKEKAFACAVFIFLVKVFTVCLCFSQERGKLPFTVGKPSQMDYMRAADEFPFSLETGGMNLCHERNREKRSVRLSWSFLYLRHGAINNLRLAGNDYFKIMAKSGHKTMNVFKRYKLAREEELSNLSWHEWAESSGR
jgi:hypothetical protein